jgi:hypothetical protein
MGILWRRLDLPGHDAATVVEGPAGAELRGMAVFQDEAGASALHYAVRCDPGWQTTGARISGWHGAQPVDLIIARDTAGRWSLNGAVCPDVAECVDLDLVFTPATNLLPLRRLDLRVDETAEVRSAWLTWPAVTLIPLTQRYVRQSATTYGYEAELPGNEKFAGVLQVDSYGWVLDYSGLWQAEATLDGRHPATSSAQAGKPSR